MTTAENVTPLDTAKPRVIVAFAGSVGSIVPYVIFVPSSGRLIVRDLPIRSHGQVVGDTPHLVLEEVLSAPTLYGAAVTVVIEGIPPRPMRRRYPGVRELLYDPRYRQIQLSLRDVAGHLGLETPPEPEEVIKAVRARLGDDVGVLDFATAWVVATALAGAARAPGELIVVEPGDAPRKERAPRRQKPPLNMATATVLTLADVAQTLKIDRTTAYRMARRGDFAFFTAGRQIRVRRQDFEAYLITHRNSSQEERALERRGKLIVLPRVTLEEDDEEKGRKLAEKMGL